MCLASWYETCLKADLEINAPEYLINTILIQVLFISDGICHPPGMS